MKEQADYQRFLDERPLMKRDPYWASERAHGELEELQAELIEDPNLWEHAQIALELADVMCFLFVIANNYGINLSEAVTRKIGLNEERFKPEEWQSGNYDEAYALVKEREGRPVERVIFDSSSAFARDTDYIGGSD